MLNRVTSVFSPGGSGGFIRRMAEASLRAVKEFDTRVAEADLSPFAFPVEKLGDLILVSIDEDGTVLRAKTVKNAPGKGYQWAGPCTPKANLFRVLDFVGDNPLDRQKFLDYVYNFRHVLIDLKKKTIVIVDDSTADAMAESYGAEAPRIGAIHAALGL